MEAACSITKILLIFVFCYKFGTVYGSCCPDGWTSFNGSCYFFGHHDLDFLEAERFCTHYGAHLTSIETMSENTFIKSHLQNYQDPKHWIGLTDEIVEGTWKWYSTDNTATFTDWGSRQPDGGRAASCGAIWASYHYQWVEEACTHLYKPICERKENIEVEAVGK